MIICLNIMMTPPNVFGVGIILLELDVSSHHINNSGRGFYLMKNSHLSATLDLVWSVLAVIYKFKNKGRNIGRMSTLERVL